MSDKSDVPESKIVATQIKSKFLEIFFGRLTTPTICMLSHLLPMKEGIECLLGQEIILA